MKRLISAIAILIMLSLIPAFSQAASFTQTIGDDDDFQRSTDEDIATNGAQYTDMPNDDDYQKRFIFDFGTDIANIGYANLEVKTFDVEDAQREPEYVDIQINVEGHDLSGAFDNTGAVGGEVVTTNYNLFNYLNSSTINSICSDGIITVDFLNAGTYQEMYAIDYVTLSIEEGSTTSSSISTTTSLSSATTTSIRPSTTTSANSTTTTTTISESSFTISGTVTGVIGSNVPMTLTGADSQTVYTDFTRYYEFANLNPGYYIITPVLDGYAFDPPSREIPNLTTDLSGLDFVSRKARPCVAEKIYNADSYQLLILRILRDNVLSKTPEGREIIKLYYLWSLVIVKAMEVDEEFKEEVKEMIETILPLINEGDK
jgi:hypothetical protein